MGVLAYTSANAQTSKQSIETTTVSLHVYAENLYMHSLRDQHDVGSDKMKYCCMRRVRPLLCELLNILCSTCVYQCVRSLLCVTHV